MHLYWCCGVTKKILCQSTKAAGEKDPLTYWRRPVCHDGGEMGTWANDLVLNPAQPKGGETR